MFTRASGGTTSVKASDSEDVDKVAGSHSNLESESESKSFQSVGGSQSQIGQTPDLLESLYYPTYNPSDVTWSPTSKGSHPDLWFHVISLLHPSMLPKQFGMIQIPLEDPHVLKFQTIVPTPRFSLLTIANLSHSTRVDDESIVGD
ncbi:uncharacterized protein EI90DRAFT_262111 [Cantharellus anzutake]|uniref:uncharacterized protein n=1 Tax=Cantharellus anzutake TaxID=1750568 RepID=UPI001907036D|nr:uncharacterized protein EI90DRAFT_262111 [Cantharellus anzutake]KAF8335821.1 hypothetical protein EI90DRAFT_262111 [Cantharellus anzutake]